MRHFLYILIALASTIAAHGDTISLTAGPPFNFTSGSDLFIRFSVWNYAVNNRDSSPYPTSVGLQLLGARPSVSTLNTVPNTSDTYFAGYLLQGWLESSDGSVSTPFTNPDAVRLGLAAGSLLLGPGVLNNANNPLAVIEADAAVTLNLSQQVFGPDIANRDSSAVIHLRNVGQDLQVGLDGGYSVLSAISEPSITGAGPVTTSGITQSVSVTSVPEPGSLPLLAGALVALLAAYLFAKRSLFRRLPKTESGPA